MIRPATKHMFLVPIENTAFSSTEFDQPTRPRSSLLIVDLLAHSPSMLGTKIMNTDLRCLHSGFTSLYFTALLGSP